MKRTSFGSVAASLSPNNQEGAIMLNEEATRHLRSHLQWMRDDDRFVDITRALMWIETNIAKSAS